MLRTLWLTFAQAVTIGLALLFIVTTLKPEWAVSPSGLLRPEPQRPANSDASARPDAGAPVSRDSSILSYATAAKLATPSVVNIFTTKSVRVTPNHPLFNDPLFRRFFGDQFSQQQQTSSLGS
ncbi:MAG: 2-alkenal reductase, partial [Quisquiliibacterium sp.]